jgi:Delta7-sterol 5-desaturase
MTELIFNTINVIWTQITSILFFVFVPFPVPNYWHYSFLFIILFNVLLYKKIKSKRTMEGDNMDPKQLKREFKYSFISQAVFALIGNLQIAFLPKLGFGFYTTSTTFTDILSLQGILFSIFVFVAIMLWHDTWFYWTHRAMHHPKIFKHVHKVHHLSRKTNVMTAVAFHQLEAVIESVWLIPFVILIPTHPIPLLAFVLFEGVHTVYGHSGYELFPSWWTKHWFFKHKTAIATHHSMHHEKVNGNYGLYFTWWDKLNGTEFADYESKFESIAGSSDLRTASVESK